MTQAISQQPLLLQLTPMELVAATPIGASSSGTLATELPTTDLQVVLRPGEPSDVAILLTNRSAQPLSFSLQVDGTFPIGWCQLVFDGRAGLDEQELLPGQPIEGLLRFQLPIDCFEQQTLAPDRALSLDHDGYLRVFYRDRGGHQHVELAQFRLYVRPHSLYLNFLPTIYREIDFVGRFLSIFEQAFEPAVHTLNTMWAHLDPLTAPEALLPFLAHWVAWQLDPRWTRDQQRRLIRNAMEIYRWRGTRRGLRLYLHLYTGLPIDDHLLNEAEKHIQIEERFSEGFVLGGTHVGPEAMLGGGQPYHFRVCLRPQSASQIDEQLVRYIIEREKPAFCTYELTIAPEPNRSSEHDGLPAR